MVYLNTIKTKLSQKYRLGSVGFFSRGCSQFAEFLYNIFPHFGYILEIPLWSVRCFQVVNKEHHIMVFKMIQHVSVIHTMIDIMKAFWKQTICIMLTSFMVYLNTIQNETEPKIQVGVVGFVSGSLLCECPKFAEFLYNIFPHFWDTLKPPLWSVRCFQVVNKEHHNMV